MARLIMGLQRAFNGQSNAILGQDLAQELLTVQINNKGLGVNLKGIEKLEAFWHAGQNLGYTALFYGLIQEGKGAVILLNSDGGERLMQEWMTSVAHAYDWPVLKSYEAQKIPSAFQQSVVGKYSTPDQSTSLSIEIKKGELYMRGSDSKKGYKLYKIDTNRYTFKNAQDYYSLSFNLTNKNVELIYSESVGKTAALQKVQ